MRLIFVNRFYWPETPATGQLLTDLAEGLARRGHDVSVITSGPAGSKSETHCGVHIGRIRSTRLVRFGLAGKALDFATFYLGALGRLLCAAREDTFVVAMTDPPLLGIGAWLVARARGARVVQWVQDIYPELAIELGGVRSLAALRPWRNGSWRASAACVTLGDDMAAILARAGVPAAKLNVIPNWAPTGAETADAAATEALRAAWNLRGQFVVAYAGNLGRVHDLAPLLAVADLLREDHGITFVFIGGGAQRPALEAEARRRNLRRVIFQPAQPRARLAETLALGDLHLVTLRPGCEQLVFPSKLYGIAAAGRPILFVGPAGCEVARTVERNHLGRAVGRDDPSAIAAVIRALAADPAERTRLGEAARRFGGLHTAEAAAARWHELFALLETCAAPSAAGITPRTP